MKGKLWIYLRKTALILADLAVFAASVAVLVFSGLFSIESETVFFVWLAINALVLLAALAVLGLYDVVLSAVSIMEIFKTGLSALMMLLGNVIFAAVTNWQYLSLGGALAFACFLFMGTAGLRMAKRAVLLCKYYAGGGNAVRVMVVGGGEAGAALLREMRVTDKVSYRAVCIVDDDPEKQGKRVGGVKIAGTTADIPKLAEKYNVKEIMITMPSVPQKRISEIIKIAQKTTCNIKILPGIYQLVSGQITVSQFRDVDVQDLLGREQVQVDLDQIMGYIENKTVLVTGGGGSIGSELCRQIASHNPRTLIILDIYENNAYEIEQEIRRHYPYLNVLTLIASVRDSVKMRDVFKKYRPQIVFHAAAHKHVPLMETSPNEAVKNNVFGTLNVARCADEFEAETFVQISTDKAVNPTNVMGATKRICEMIVQTIGRQSKHTKFVAVRFGNVLGSNGSVIPLFKKQIAEGGPVTVTHKDIIRYFMTIPEAVSLVLQAGAYAKGGQIFVLDMGEPVRIYDLAYNLIKLSGLEPNVDINIVCTGLRPGEKLFEERLMEEEGLTRTPNGLINIARPIQLDEEHLWSCLEKLQKEVQQEGALVKETVKALVPTYTIDSRDSIAEALGRAENNANVEQNQAK